MVGKRIGKRNNEHPGIDAVEQEGDDRFSAGAQCKISTMREGAQRHCQGGNHNKWPGQLLDVFLGIVNGREKPSHKNHKDTDTGTGENAEKDHLIVRIPGLFLFAGPQKLTHHNRDAASQLKIDNIKQVADGGGDILGGHHLQAPDCVALGDHSHTGGPEHLVEHKRGTLDQNTFQDIGGDLGAGVSADNIGIWALVAMSPDHHNGKLHKTCYYRCNGSSPHAHCGGERGAEDQ